MSVKFGFDAELQCIEVWLLEIEPNQLKPMIFFALIDIV